MFTLIKQHLDNCIQKRDEGFKELVQGTKFTIFQPLKETSLLCDLFLLSF